MNWQPDNLPPLETVRQKIASLCRWLAVGLCTLCLYPSSAICALLDRQGRVAHLHHRFWARLILFCVGARMQVYGLHHLDPAKTYVLAVNHEGNVDIPILISGLPLQFKFGAKRSLFKIPFFGWALGHARYVAIDRAAGPEKAKEAIARLTEKIQRGFSILMFPEGTRTPNGRIQEFKSGAFRLAQMTDCEILPMAIFGSRRGQGRGEWIIRPGKIIVNIGAAMAPEKLSGESEAEIRWLKDRCRQEITRLHAEAEVLDQLPAGIRAEPRASSHIQPGYPPAKQMA